ncbi:MAG: hypothetical protein LUF30_11675 [Lachnospiraceae bacterium]|nr:hypothetical protein [Lachnospiraceae bacterium]
MFYRKFVFGKRSANNKVTEMPLGEGHSLAMAELVSVLEDNSCESCADEKDGEVIAVSSSDLYKLKKGYGFETEENRRQQELLRFPELNSGFETVYWYQDETLTHLEEDEDGCYLRSGLRRTPLIFKLDVPQQGNYRVTVKIRTAGEAFCETESETRSGEQGCPGRGRDSENVSSVSDADWLIFTGRRRLGGDWGIGENFHEAQPIRPERSVILHVL